MSRPSGTTARCVPQTCAWPKARRCAWSTQDAGTSRPGRTSGTPSWKSARTAAASAATWRYTYARQIGLRTDTQATRRTPTSLRMLHGTPVRRLWPMLETCRRAACASASETRSARSPTSPQTKSTSPPIHTHACPTRLVPARPRSRTRQTPHSPFSAPPVNAVSRERLVGSVRCLCVTATGPRRSTRR